MAHLLPDRGVILLTGEGARAWLDNLVTNDLEALGRKPAVFTGLLSPQGKLLFEFFVISHGNALLLDVHAASVHALIKRLTLYRLRTPVVLEDVSASWISVWAANVEANLYADPRAPKALWRGLVPKAATAAAGDYASARVAAGVAEAPNDYALGDTFPHEANFDLRDGVSFKKGCFIGQEVVARMQNKAVVRKRVVRIAAAAPLAHGSEISTGSAVIGKVGTVAGNGALAMLRLDRAAEAIDKGQSITAGGASITIDAAALSAYRHAAANRPEIDL